MPERFHDLWAQSAAILIGIAAFFAFAGWWVLIPTNIAWLDFADRAMHQLGWMFYRDAPWGIPPGRNVHLGIELSNSIGLVDGLPLVAIPLKLIEHWLPRPFQFFGYWLLLSFALQSFLAFRIARELGAGRWIALAAGAFAVITPAYLFRIPMHLALSSHWVVLAALYLYMRRVPPPLWMWPLLLGVASAIHGTLLALVFLLWIAALVQRLALNVRKPGGTTGELLLGIVTIVVVLWTAGFLGTSSYAAAGFGNYKLNLLWPIIKYDWSTIFPAIPHTFWDYEGLSFLGIGILALIVIAVVSLAVAPLRHLFTRRWWPLTVTLLAMMVFGFSHIPAFADHELFKLPLHESVDRLVSAFRSSGRFIWPLLYVVTIGTVVLIGRRFRPAIAVPLVVVAFLAQAADSYPQWSKFRTHMKAPSSEWDISLDSPFWERAAGAGYNRIRSIPVDVAWGSDWRDPGYFALNHGMDIDIVYLGRIDKDAEAALRARAAEILQTGEFEPRTIYILNDVPSALAAAKHAGPNDLLATFDNRIVFVRDGKALAEGLDAFPFWSAD